MRPFGHGQRRLRPNSGQPTAMVGRAWSEGDQQVSSARFLGSVGAEGPPEDAAGRAGR
jgi:hypothetical protein